MAVFVMKLSSSVMVATVPPNFLPNGIVLRALNLPSSGKMVIAIWLRTFQRVLPRQKPN